MTNISFSHYDWYGGDIMKNKLPDDKTAFLLKFVIPEYEDDFIQGKLYMNPLQYFINREKESGVRGVGDALEASAVFVDVDLTFKHPVTNEILMTGNAGRINFHSNNRVQSPVLCMYSVDKEVLKIVSEDETYINAKPIIEPTDLEKLISDFGDNMLIINAAKFAERVMRKCKEDNIICRMGKVKYYDFSRNYSDRINAYNDLENSDICFIKDDFFRAQNEFRILLENIYKDSHYILNVGDLSDITTKFKISDFFSGRYELAFNKSSLYL